MLASMPRRLFVKVEGRTWTVRPELGAGVYVVNPVYRQWARDGDGLAKVRRHGFPVVVDFSGTAHSYTGQTLAASLGPSGGAWHARTRSPWPSRTAPGERGLLQNL